MLVEPLKKIQFQDLKANWLPFLDKGGILHVTNFPGSELFFEVFRNQFSNTAKGGIQDWEEIYLDRNVKDLQTLAAATKVLKILVHNHAFAMTALPLIERIGCSLDKTNIDSGVIRYQLTNNLREKAESSRFFEAEDFSRINPNAVPEIFGDSKLPPHRDVRWPHIRILGGWMPLTNLADGETLTLFPEVFSKIEAITDPNITPFPDVNSPNQFGLGVPISPAMQAGDFLLFHASTVHSSPVSQTAPFRGSLDFRVSYPCLDDFSHYKWTFIQAKNLINTDDKAHDISLKCQKKALNSLVSELFEHCGIQKSIHEIRLKHKDKNASLHFLTILRILISHFCPDTYLKIFDQVKRPGQRLLLLSILLRSQSYFWLYKGFLTSKKNGFIFIGKFLKMRTISVSKKTILPIRNVPISWPGEPRELLPSEVLKELYKDN